MRMLTRLLAAPTAVLCLTIVPGPAQSAPVALSPGATAAAAVTGDSAGDLGRRHRPNARRDVYRVNEDRRLRVRPRGVLRNDRDARHRLRARKVSNPEHGRARLSRRGKLVYKPVADHVGRDRFVYKAIDTRGRSDRARVVIRTRPVNDAPTFLAGLDQELPAVPLPVSIPDWATSVSPGPPDEADQQITFVVEMVEGAGLFSTAPAVAPDGALSFVPSGVGTGVAVFDVIAQDDGGTRRRGDDTSDPQRFAISLVPGVVLLPDQPSILEGADVLLSVAAAALPGELTYRFDCDGDGTFESGDLTTADHTCAFPDDGAFQPAVEVLDGGGGTHGDVTDVLVGNVAPELTPPAGGSATEQVAALLPLGSFTDPGADGPWNVLVDWGDGTTDSFTSASGSLGSRSHTWNLDDPALEYVVTVTVTEASGAASDTATFVVDLLPVNDPPTVLPQVLEVPLADLLTGVEVPAATLLAGATDPEGDPLQVTSLTESEPLLTVAESPTGWTLQGTALLAGETVPLVYGVSDGNGGTDTGTLDLVVGAL